MGLKAILGRMTRSHEELTSAERERLAKELGCDQLGLCQDRQKVTVRGTVDSLTFRPKGDVPWMEAELSDGTGSVVIVWMGRYQIPGVKAGSELLVRGRLSDVDDIRRIFNPWYQLL